jgi:hypothetical protein
MARQQKHPKAADPAPAGVSTGVQPSQTEIARRAHEIYLARGGAHGFDLEDWLQAERELKPNTGYAPEQDYAQTGKSKHT